jgi:hypothetical protein
MTRRQNRIGESIGLLPDGDTGPSILGDTRQRTNIASATAPLADAAQSHNHIDTKGN